MKNNIEYYQHFTGSHSHPKFKMLRVEYGWEGEGKFWALNNMIGDSKDCKLDLSRKFIVADIVDLFGMDKTKFNEFITYLVEECELLIREGNFITTETVQENYGLIKVKRLKNQKSYKQRIEKVDSIGENNNSETESEIQSTERIQSKVKKSKVNESKEKKSKVGEITSSLFFEMTKNLFEKHTRISDPNIETHIAPIIEIWNSIPENLNQEIVENCIIKTFEALDKNNGVNISYLVENIMKRITKKHEEVLSKAKGKILKEAETERISYKKQENEQILKENADKIEQYKIFYNKNQGLFSAKDKSLLVRFFKENKVLSAGGIIEPKMAKVELV